MRDFPMPIVTAVNGAAAGVGCSMALMGDIVIAGESAYFLQAFRRIGLVPDGGSTYLLPRLIGRARAMEMTLLGERVSAAKALEWGLINRVVADADLMTEATKLAVELSNGPKALGPDPQADVAFDGRRVGRPAPRRSQDPERSRPQRGLRRGREGFPGKAASGFRGEVALGISLRSPHAVIPHAAKRSGAEMRDPAGPLRKSELDPGPTLHCVALRPG